MILILAVNTLEMHNNQAINSVSTFPAYVELVEGDIKNLNEHICVLQDSLLQCGK
jgi:hypothetical protein